ncbi:HD domain-containing protein [bacterium]|nr:HD domain-containing protein [bacterium]
MAENESRQFRFYLAALRDLSAALVGSRSRADTALPLRESLYRVLGTFAAGRGIVFLWHENEKKLVQHAAKGIRGRAVSFALTPADARALSLATRPFRVLMPPGGTEKFCAELKPVAEKLKLEWAAPLVTGGALIGLLLLSAPLAGKTYSDVQLDILEQMATMIALPVADSRVRRRLADQVMQLQTAGRQLRQIYLETLRMMAGVIDGPSEDARPSHSLRVAALAAETGRRLNLAPEVCDRLYLAGLLHDIGKQIISRDLLESPGPLSANERREVEEHPRIGYDLISHLRFPWGDVARIIRHHHERLDGRGYPDHLKGDQISIEAKVLMMAESFDAMTSDQPWRPRLSFDKVVEQIHGNLDMQFDPRVAAALCQAVADGLDGNAREKDFVPHLEEGFDPSVIRHLLEELRRQLATPTLRPKAKIVEI